MKSFIFERDGKMVYAVERVCVVERRRKKKKRKKKEEVMFESFTFLSPLHFTCDEIFSCKEREPPLQHLTCVCGILRSFCFCTVWSVRKRARPKIVCERVRGCVSKCRALVNLLPVKSTFDNLTVYYP